MQKRQWLEKFPVSEKERKVLGPLQCNVIHCEAWKGLRMALPRQKLPSRKKSILLSSLGVPLLSTDGELGKGRRTKKDFPS